MSKNYRTMRYCYKVVSIVGPKMIRRGEDKTYRLLVKNIGTETWKDYGIRSKAEEGEPLIGAFISEDESSRKFKYTIGPKIDKNDYRFFNIYKKRWSKPVKSNFAKPGNYAEFLININAKRLATKGRHVITVNIGDLVKRRPIKSVNNANITVHILPAKQKGLKNIIPKNVRPNLVETYENGAYRSVAESNRLASFQPVAVCIERGLARLPETLKDLIKQKGSKPVLYLWTNKDKTDRELKSIVLKSKLPIKVFVSAYNVGGFGKFYLAKEISATNEFVLFVGDNQSIANTAVRQFFDEAGTETIYAQQAFVFESLDNYWDKRELFPGQQAHYCRAGGMICPTKIFNDPRVFECPRKYWLCEELWFSFVATKFLNFKLEKSKTNLLGKEDEEEPDESLVDIKTEFLKYLVVKRKWGIKTIPFVVVKNSISITVPNGLTSKSDYFYKVRYSNWEQASFWIYDHFSAPTKIFIDIGGWNGCTSIYAAKLNKHVISLEPDPVSLKDYHRVLSANKATNITLIEKPLYKDSSYVNFSPLRDAWNTSSSHIKNSLSSGKKMSAVSWREIEEYIKNIEPKGASSETISLIKIDIESNEEFLRETLKKIDPNISVFISFHYSRWTAPEQLEMWTDIFNKYKFIYATMSYGVKNNDLLFEQVVVKQATDYIKGNPFTSLLLTQTPLPDIPLFKVTHKSA